MFKSYSQCFIVDRFVPAPSHVTLYTLAPASLASIINVRTKPACTDAMLFDCKK